jgi:hypothetical protein
MQREPSCHQGRDDRKNGVLEGDTPVIFQGSNHVIKHNSWYFTAAVDMRDSDPGDDVDDATGLTYTCAAPRADR